MRFSDFSAILIQAVAVSASAIASRNVDHSLDGIYMANGRVADLEDIELGQIAARGNTRRGNHDGVGCDNDDHGTVGFNPILAERAAMILKLYCNQFANSHRNCDLSIWVKDGDVVVFYCKWRDAEFNPDSLDNALSMVADQCANGNGGSFSDKDEEHRNYSYGVTNWMRKGWCNLEAGSDF